MQADKHYDDLTQITGLGKKSQSRLYDADICTFADLADATPEQICKVLDGMPVNPDGWSVAASKYVERIGLEAEVDREFELRIKELMRQKRAAGKALARLETPLQNGKYGDVTGFGVELKTKGGLEVLPLKYVMHVCVRFKLSEDDLKKKRVKLLPKEVDGVEIKVTELNPYHPSNGNVGNVGNESVVTNVVKGGMPISEANQLPSGNFNEGTYGIRIPCSNGTAIGIANQHFARKGKVMIQPPVADWEDFHRIGVVKDSKYKRKPGVDAAIVELENTLRDFRFGVHGFEDDSKFVFAAKPLKTSRDVGAIAYKFGAKTATKLAGKIKSVDFNIDVGRRQFREIIRVRSPRSFIEDGDSGSVLVLDISKVGSPKLFLVAGLFFAGSKTSEKYGYACHFSEVINVLKLKIPQEKTRTDWTPLK